MTGYQVWYALGQKKSGHGILTANNDSWLRETTKSLNQEESRYNRQSNRCLRHTSQKRYSSNQIVWKLLCILSCVTQHDTERNKTMNQTVYHLPHISLRAIWYIDRGLE